MLTHFFVHNFEAKWQDAQFKSCLDNLTKEQIVTVIDLKRTTILKNKMKSNFNIG
jgi:hypothetical protein